MASAPAGPAAAAAGAEPEAGPGCRRPALCEWCGEGAAKYRCPACELRTCSAACVRAHKEERECSGKRPRTSFVAPLRAFSNQDVIVGRSQAVRVVDGRRTKRSSQRTAQPQWKSDFLDVLMVVMLRFWPGLGLNAVFLDLGCVWFFVLGG
ncbi:unnamed protein product, partial [Prorocentrum cordatum]